MDMAFEHRGPMLLTALLLAGCLPPGQVDFRDEPIGIASAELVLSPADLDFGYVPIGSFETRSIEATNHGTTDVLVTSIAAPFSAEFSLGSDNGLRSIPPGGSAEWSVRYAPQKAGDGDTTLVVSTSDRRLGELVVPIKGGAWGPVLEVHPPTHSFGVVEAGCVIEFEVELRNVGNRELTLEEIGYDDSSGGDLSIVDAPAAGRILGPYGVERVTVQYAPRDGLLDTAILRVASNDPVHPVVTAEHTGLDSFSPVVEEEFVQSGDGALDVLFVVRGGPNMDDARQRITQGFGVYLDALEALDLDYRIGVLSMHSGDDGALVGPQDFIDAFTPEPEHVFGRALQELSAGPQRGFENAWLHVSDPDAPEAGFLRQRAGLQVVFAARGADGSVDSPSYWLPGWSPELLQAKADPASVELSNISGGLAGCSDDDRTADPAQSYVLAAVNTGGTSLSICEPDLGPGLGSMAEGAPHRADRFRLGHSPVPDSVQVQVDGVTSSGWSMDGETVVFDLDRIPANGSTVAVSYHPLAEGCE
jgi:hypothetical protein